MKRVNLLLVWHHHQPVGNLLYSVDRCYEQSYLPLLQFIEEYPEIKIHLHYSGPLLEYFKNERPEFLQRLKKLSAQGRIQFLGGGFYEPVLVDLDEEDRIGQMEMMRQFLHQHLDAKATGCWLAEDVWAPSLARSIQKSGLSFSILDSLFFERAGLRKSDLHGHYTAEYHGSSISIFPNSTALTRALLYTPLDDVFGQLRRMANRDEDITLTVALNTEAWSNLPGSTDHVLEYIPQFFSRLKECSDWIRLRLFDEYLNEQPSKGRLDLPAGNPTDLGGWSLMNTSREEFFKAKGEISNRYDADRFLPFLQSGSWSGFRTRYAESNRMAAKARLLKEKLQEQKRYQDDSLRQSLYRAQCNTAYWYGFFGGLYLPYLRAAVWKNLLAIEHSLNKKKVTWEMEQRDVDGDGQKEWLVANKEISVGIQPHYGGSCFEISSLPKWMNFSNTLTRRREPASHAPQDVIQDWYLRTNFLDHFFARGTSVEELKQNRVVELGDFVNQPYQVKEQTSTKHSITLTLERNGGLYRNQLRQPVLIQKRYEWEHKRSAMKVVYQIENTSPLPLEAVFAVEWNLFVEENRQNIPYLQFQGGEKVSLDASVQRSEVKEFQIFSANGEVGCAIQAEKTMEFWSYPIQSYDSDGNQSIVTLQGSACLLGVHLDIKPEQAFECEFVVSVL